MLNFKDEFGFELSNRNRVCACCGMIRNIYYYDEKEEGSNLYTDVCKMCLINEHPNRYRAKRMPPSEQMMQNIRAIITYNGSDREIDYLSDARIDEVRDYIECRGNINVKTMRKVLYYFDGQHFYNNHSLHRYISREYGININTVRYRLEHGYSLEDCTKDEHFYRNPRKCAIIVRDEITGEEFEFESLSDPGLLEMMSTNAAARSLKSGKPVEVRKSSKYHHPLSVRKKFVE